MRYYYKLTSPLVRRWMTTTAAAAAAAEAAGSSSPQTTGIVRSVGQKLKTSFAVLGVVAAGGLYFEYKAAFPSLDEDSEKNNGNSSKTKKKVLVIPFNRIVLKDQQSQSNFPLDSFDPDSTDRTLQFEVRELVDLIHHAASDPNIVALYGTFGHGSVLNSAGWADLEEVRNALKVFREAHRSHSEPNLSHNMQQFITRTESKPLYAYADTFSHPADNGNKDYYIASIFTHVHMQENGELNLAGMYREQFFLKGLLEKYGVMLHVFKHGEYKNAPNMFTEVAFTKAHRENVRTVLDAMDADVCADITSSRSKALLTSWFTKRTDDDIWKRIHDSGTFPAATAWSGGLIDYLPRRDPLRVLLDGNKSTQDKIKLRMQWKPHETDFVKFKAEEAVSVTWYAKKIRKQKLAEARKKRLTKLLVRYPNVAAALTAVGVSVPKEPTNKEKIALLYVQGTIGDQQARKTVNSIRKIAQDKDTKCVVLRVSSPGGSIFACETISQELKGLNVPVVVSFGNVAASGGYYVSATANRVFASHKSVTGSIGVFGIRADLTGLTDRYGIKIQHEAAGNLSALYSPFHPMSNKMKKVVSSNVDRYYDQFKEVVSSGRGLSLEDVEAIARGRVWTGGQAKRNGLVDELGGLYRAIAYARRSFTETDAEVVVWPKKRSLVASLMERIREEKIEGGSLTSAVVAVCSDYLSAFLRASDDNETDVRDEAATLQKLMSQFSQGLPGPRSGVFYAIDEKTALRCLVDGVGEERSAKRSLDTLWRWRGTS